MIPSPERTVILEGPNRALSKEVRDYRVGAEGMHDQNRAHFIGFSGNLRELHLCKEYSSFAYFISGFYLCVDLSSRLKVCLLNRYVKALC